MEEFHRLKVFSRSGIGSDVSECFSVNGVGREACCKQNQSSINGLGVHKGIRAGGTTSLRSAGQTDIPKCTSVVEGIKGISLEALSVGKTVTASRDSSASRAVTIEVCTIGTYANGGTTRGTSSSGLVDACAIVVAISAPIAIRVIVAIPTALEKSRTSNCTSPAWHRDWSLPHFLIA